MSAVRIWTVAILGAAVVAAGVLFASERQRMADETNFREAAAAGAMEVAMLSQERALDGFLASGHPPQLLTLFQARLRLTQGLAEARRLARDDKIETSAVAAQKSAFARWTALALAAVSRKQKSGADDSAARERTRSLVIDSFLAANQRYEARLRVNRYREERAAAFLPVWVLLGLGAVFAMAGVLLGRRKQAVAGRRAAFARSQARFAEGIQFAENETEAHGLLSHHLETTIAGSSVVVLNRNNSADRLEAAGGLPDGHPLREPLLSSEPRACLAVRLNRGYEREPDDPGSAALECELCGRLPVPSSCQPLLVGGEVIGSVLVARERSLDGEAKNRLQQSVVQAAPMLANLRNLAIAESLAATDSLTGLPNRRTIDDTLHRMLAQAARTASPFSLAVLDLDHFKQINDNYGHERGDDVLAAFATLLTAHRRASDFAGRNGGEEFVLFLPDTDRAEAVVVAEQIRRDLHKLHVAGVDRPTTTTIGIATFPDDARTPETLMRAADRNLYAAKRQGRDRVEARTAADHHLIRSA